MKTLFLTISIAFMSLVSLNARENTLETLPTIEGTYLEEVLQQHDIVNSSVMDKDYLMTTFLLENKRKFNTADLLSIKQNLEKMSANELMILNGVDFKDPTISLILSVFVGELGIDRFYIGDIGLGVVKLITCGGFGVWWLVDLFTITGKTKKNNVKEFQETMLLQDALAK